MRFKKIGWIFILGCLQIHASENGSALHDTGRICAVDMGSNTFKFAVAEIKNGVYLQYLDVRKTSGVGDDLRASEKTLKRKVISDSKIQEIQLLLGDFQTQCRQQTQSTRLYAIATAAFREAENIDSIREKLQAQGIGMKVLSQQEESQYAYKAATLGESGLAVLDLGSRTTEFVSNTQDRFEWRLLNTGYKVAWDDFYQNAPTFQEAKTHHVSNLRAMIQGSELKVLKNQKELVVIEVGETASYVLELPQDQIEGKVITRSQLQSKLRGMQRLDAKSFADLKRDFKDAAKVLPRAIFLDYALEATGYNSFRCTNRELNAAVILDLALQ